jgi:hypothetical protein
MTLTQSQLLPILSQMNQIHATPYYKFFSEIHLMFSSHVRLRLPNSLFPSHFPTKTLYALLSLISYVPCLDLIILLIFDEEYKL